MSKTTEPLDDTVKVKRYKDKEHGLVTVIEHEDGFMATNAKPDTKGHWVEKDGTYTYEFYKPNQLNSQLEKGTK